MAQIDPDLYSTIAVAYASLDANLTGISTDSRTALDALVDITTTTYPDPSANADAALELELALLQPFNVAYQSVLNLESGTSSVLAAIRELHTFILRNISGTATAQSKLDDFINVDVKGVPQGWINLCTDAGYTTTNWNVV